MEGYTITVVIGNGAIIEINDVTEHTFSKEELTIYTSDGGMTVFIKRNLIGWSDSLSATNEILTGMDQ